MFRKIMCYTFCIMVCLSLVITTIPLCSLAETPEQMTAYFIDVGSEDATLIGCGNKVILIDAGGKQNGTTVHPYLAKYWKANCTEGEELEVMVIATHPHADHIGGLNMILGSSSAPGSHYTVKSFYMLDLDENADSQHVEAYQKIEGYLNKLGIKREVPQSKFKVNWGDMVVTMYYMDGYTGNNSSIVTKVKYGNTTILVAGDAEWEEETALLSDRVTLRSDVLRVGHHGSDTSTTEAWLNAIQPKYAIISVGNSENPDKPASVVLDRLMKAHCSVWQTRFDGTIVLKSNGDLISIASESASNVNKNNAQYVGTINKKKLHRATCSFKSKNESNVEYFMTLEDAEIAGYTEKEQCSKCRPFDDNE